MAKKEGGVAKIEGGVAKKWKTVAKSANLLAKKIVSLGFETDVATGTDMARNGATSDSNERSSSPTRVLD